MVTTKRVVTLASLAVLITTVSWSEVGGRLSPVDNMRTMSPEGTVESGGTQVENSGLPRNLVLIPAGVFTMGSPADEPSRDSGEPKHTVTLTTSFHMWATEVTNQQYAELAQWAYDHGYCKVNQGETSLLDALDGSTMELLVISRFLVRWSEISFTGGTFTVKAGKEDRPVLGVTWYGAAAYCDWLSLREGLPRAYDHRTWLCSGNHPYKARGYRLPTEAEWEYACRAGTQTPFHTGSCLNAKTEANYNGFVPYSRCPSGPSIGWTVAVGSYPPNAYGLYDMHGNLAEWCNDWYGDYDGNGTDPTGPGSASWRVYRGGGCDTPANGCRSASRHFTYPVPLALYFVGFRPVRSAK